MPEHVFGTKNLKEGFSFIGYVKSAKWTLDNKYATISGKEVLELIIESLDDTKFERTLNIPYSNRINSKWGKFNEALENSGMPFDPDKFTEQDLIDQIFEWQTFNLEFGQDITTQMLLPVRYLGSLENRDKIMAQQNAGAFPQQPKQEIIPETQPKTENIQPVELPKEQEKEQETQNQEQSNLTEEEELIIAYVKFKKNVLIRDLVEKFHTSREKLLPILFELSEKKKVIINGQIVSYVE